MKIRTLLTLLSAAIILAFVMVESIGLYHDEYHITVSTIMVLYLAIYYAFGQRMEATSNERRLYRRISIFCWILLLTILVATLLKYWL